jgi:hypothetical protein
MNEVWLREIAEERHSQMAARVVTGSRKVCTYLKYIRHHGSRAEDLETYPLRLVILAKMENGT